MSTRDERLAAIRARRAAIVGTDWTDNGYSQVLAHVPYGHPWDMACREDEPSPVMTPDGGVAAIAWIVQRPDHQGHGDELHSAEARANREFIVNAPRDIPYLLAQLEASEAERERLREKLAEIRDYYQEVRESPFREDWNIAADEMAGKARAALTASDEGGEG